MNQVLAAVQGLAALRAGIEVDPRAALAVACKTAITRLARDSINATEVGDGSLIVDEAFVYWPSANYWRSAANASTRGYGIDKLIEAVTVEAVVEAARAYVE